MHELVTSTSTAKLPYIRAHSPQCQVLSSAIRPCVLPLSVGGLPLAWALRPTTLKGGSWSPCKAAQGERMRSPPQVRSMDVECELSVWALSAPCFFTNTPRPKTSSRTPSILTDEGWGACVATSRFASIRFKAHGLCGVILPKLSALTIWPKRAPHPQSPLR